MIYTAHTANALAESPLSKPAEELTCLRIKTGLANCVATFYPSLYQLTLVRDGIEEKVDLGYSGGRLLERLLRTPGDVVDRDELMRHAWSDRVVGQGSLNQQIYTLRQILGDEKDRMIIQTLPRRGYLINPTSIEDVNATTAREPDSEAVTTEAATSETFSTNVTDEPLFDSTIGGNIAINQSVSATQRTPLVNKSTVIAASLGAFAMFLAMSVANYVGSDKGTFTVSVAGNDTQIQSLTPISQELELKFKTQVRSPVHWVITEAGDTVNLTCIHHSGGAQQMNFPRDQLSHINATQLAPCLSSIK